MYDKNNSLTIFKGVIVCLYFFMFFIWKANKQIIAVKKSATQKTILPVLLSIKPFININKGIANAMMALTLAIALNSLTIFEPTLRFLDNNCRSFASHFFLFKILASSTRKPVRFSKIERLWKSV